ncbi:MAG: hypothetical protein HGA65_18325, partial [Oscillochloris sp.]|nr:hypothetical protein [Oscillochloris sp.]
AAASGAVSRMQVFEARQLIDQGLSDQSGLLYDLANGEPPLAVIDYLGNWMPAQVVALLRHRYAQDGSLGTFDLYRPVDTGPQQTIDPPTEIGAGLALGSYALAAPLSPSYEPGELLIVNLGWQAGPSATTSALSVTLQLTTPEGAPLLESDLPLVYGALPPTRWPNGATVEHLQTLALPAELPTGRYGVAIGLRASGEPLGVSHQITTISVQATSGQSFEESGQFVPGPIMRAWNAQGGRERIGLPLTPAVPFAWGRLQCFELACLELRNGVVSARTLGAQLYLGETARSTACNDQATIGRICPGFATLTLRYGANLGQPISGEVLRNGWVVQWSEYARLERRPDTDTQGLGRLGEESLRLPPGGSYRWP